MQKYTGQIALITGAANGIGKALSVELASRGCHLALVDIDKDNLETTKQELLPYSVEVSIHHADISDWDQVDRVGSEVVQIHGKVNLLINSAGVSVRGNLDQQTPKDILWITGVNYLGAVFMCKRILELMPHEEPGLIVNISSGAGIHGFAKRTSYCGSKFALKGFSEALRAELYQTRIRVFCAFPGPVSTKMYRRSKYAAATDREKEKTYLDEKGMPPEKVAKTILRGIQKERVDILIGKETRILYFLKRMFPNFFPEYLYRNQDKLPA